MRASGGSPEPLSFLFLAGQFAVPYRFVNEYEEYKAASEEIAEKLRTEVQLLYEYTEKLTHVMERIECGMCARRKQPYATYWVSNSRAVPDRCCSCLPDLLQVSRS